MLLAAALLLLSGQDALPRPIPTLPDAPSPQGVHPWGLTGSLSEKYDLKKRAWDIIPQIALEFRPVQPVRLNITLSRSTASGDYSVAGGVYYKLVQWGRRR